jgi:heat shock protein HslJ
MKTSRWQAVLASFAVVALVLAGAAAIGGCSSGAKGGQIEGRTWHVRAVAVAGGELKEAFLTVPMDARYEGGKVSGNAGCSTYTGSYTISGEKLTVTGIQAVKTSCDEFAANADAAYMTLLPGAATFTVEGTELSIYDQSGKEILHCRDEAAFQNQ